MPIQDVALKSCRKRWTIEKGGEREPGVSVKMARHHDDDDDDDDDEGYVDTIKQHLQMNCKINKELHGGSVMV